MSETSAETFDRVQRSLFDEARTWGEFARSGHRAITVMVPADLGENIELPAPTSVEIVEEDTFRKIEAIWRKDGATGTGVRFSISEPGEPHVGQEGRKGVIGVHDSLDITLYDDNSLEIDCWPRHQTLSGLVRYDGSSGIILSEPHMRYTYGIDKTLEKWVFEVSAGGADRDGIRDFITGSNIRGGSLPPIQVVDNLVVVPRMRMTKSPSNQVRFCLDITPHCQNEAVDGAGDTEISFDSKKRIGIHIGTADIELPEAKVLRYRVLDALRKAVGDLRL